MFARAKQCDDAADKAAPAEAMCLHEAARHWREMATQLELLEQEPQYRIIRRRQSPVGL